MRKEAAGSNLMYYIDT